MSQQVSTRKPLEQQVAELELDAPAVVGLARQSSGDGLSVTDQTAKLEAECRARGWALIEVVTEQDISGRRDLDRRPGLNRALELIEGGTATVLMPAYFDRLARRLDVQAEVMKRVEKAGGTIITPDAGEISSKTAVDKFTAGQLGLMAEFIADQAAEKTSMRKQISIDNGVPPFPGITPAYQRREDGTLEPHATNAPLVREAIRMRLRGESLAAIGQWLHANGLVRTATRAGKKQPTVERGEPMKMNARNVAQLFASKLLIGEIHFGGFKPNLDAIEKPITDRATFARLQEMSVPRGRKAKSVRLLARQGVVRCKSCGSKMSVRSTRYNGPGSELRPYYRCGNAYCTAKASARAPELEQLVLAETKTLAEGMRGTASLDRELEKARIARETAEQQLDDAVDAFDGITSPKTKEKLQALQHALDVAVAEHDRLGRLVSPELSVTPDKLESAPLDIQRRIIVGLVEAVWVSPGRGPIAERIVVEPKGAAK
jgi:site-specific DNA recombinase